MEWQPPKEIRGMTFLSKRAGSFSGVPQRTVQGWTEKGLIKIRKPEGTGDRRQYSILNCIEIGIIAALAKHRISFDVISEAMKAMHKGSPLTLKQALQDSRAFLIIRFYESGDPRAVSCVSEERYGPRSGIEGEERKFYKYWMDATIPADKELEKTLIIDLSYIARTIEQKIAV